MTHVSRGVTTAGHVLHQIPYRMACAFSSMRLQNELGYHKFIIWAQKRSAMQAVRATPMKGSRFQSRCAQRSTRSDDFGVGREQSSMSATFMVACSRVSSAYCNSCRASRSSSSQARARRVAVDAQRGAPRGPSHVGHPVGPPDTPVEILHSSRPLAPPTIPYHGIAMHY